MNWAICVQEKRCVFCSKRGTYFHPLFNVQTHSTCLRKRLSLIRQQLWENDRKAADERRRKFEEVNPKICNYFSSIGKGEQKGMPLFGASLLLHHYSSPGHSY